MRRKMKKIVALLLSLMLILGVWNIPNKAEAIVMGDSTQYGELVIKAECLYSYVPIILDKANAIRRKHGMQELVPDKTLTDMAQFQAVELSVLPKGSVRPDGSVFNSLLALYMFSFPAPCHLSYATGTAMHPENDDLSGLEETILNPDYEAMGVGVIRTAEGKMYEVYYFASNGQSAYQYLGYPEANGTDTFGINYLDSTLNNRCPLKAEIKDAVYVGMSTEFYVRSGLGTKTEAESWTFSSADPKVAVVNAQGIVTGVKAGKTVIKATNVAQPAYSYSLEIEVNVYCDHVPTSAGNVIWPTCEKEGKQSDTICEKCGKVLGKGSVMEPLGHSWGFRTPTGDRTCQEKGEYIQWCDRKDCNATRTIEYGVGSHKAVVDPAVKATCTTDGKTEGYHCEYCNTVLTEQKTIAKTGHSWNSGTVTKQPTYTENGVKTYTCTNCKTTKTETIAKKIAKDVTVSYRTHVQNIGWQNFVSNGVMAGTSGMSKRLEGIEIKISGNENLGIQYTTHCQTYGWLPWSANGEMNGTEGESKRLEAIEIRLTGADADAYDVYYRVHAQTYGWLGWAKNGEPSGTAGQSKRLEGIQIVIKKKGEAAPGVVEGIKSAFKNAYKVGSGQSTTVNVGGTNNVNVAVSTHVQGIGWQGWKFNGTLSGTSGQSKRLEGIKIKLTNNTVGGGIRYRTNIQGYGWMSWKQDGAFSGTSGESKRLEAIQIELTGNMAQKYDVYYRVHSQRFGWLGWAKNGETAGTIGYDYRLESIQIVLVEKGKGTPANKVAGITGSGSDQSYHQR